MSTVQSIINKPITIPKESTVNDVIKELMNKKISRLLVSEGDKCTSIITEKDVGLFLLNDSTERNLNQIPISEIMKPLLWISSSPSLKECANTMYENSIGSLAINTDGTIDGIVTKTDLVRSFAENFSGKKIVGEYATLYYAWAYSDTPIYKVVRKMIDEKISRIILKSHDELPEGILTFRDLFRIALEEGSETGFGATTIAKQIMTDKIISVRYDDDLAKACNLLLDYKINAVGVLSNKGRLVGILSKTDVTRAIAFMN
jgi:CBS domain-containing protein